MKMVDRSARLPIRYMHNIQKNSIQGEARLAVAATGFHYKELRISHHDRWAKRKQLGKPSSVPERLHSGAVTAINATIAVWEGYHETMDNVSAWLRRFRTYEDVMVQARNRSTKSCRPDRMARDNVGVVLGWSTKSCRPDRMARLA